MLSEDIIKTISLLTSELSKKENITVRFGKIYNNDTEIIKVESKDGIYYLQRYYG